MLLHLERLSKLGWTHDIVRMPSTTHHSGYDQSGQARLLDYSMGSHFLTNGLSDFWASGARPSTPSGAALLSLGFRCARGENLIEDLAKLCCQNSVAPSESRPDSGRTQTDRRFSSIIGVRSREPGGPDLGESKPEIFLLLRPCAIFTSVHGPYVDQNPPGSWAELTVIQLTPICSRQSTWQTCAPHINRANTTNPRG